MSSATIIQPTKSETIKFIRFKDVGLFKIEDIRSIIYQDGAPILYT